MIDAYPLLWPAGWRREQTPVYSSFKTGLVTARNGLIRELELLGATNIVISSNATLLRTGEIAARQNRIDDTGVAAYFTLRSEQRCIPCDKWVRLEDNLHAIELTVAALRGLDRWGAKEMVDAAFRGFAALPAPGQTSGESCWDVLGLSSDATLSAVKDAYRHQAKHTHPDRSGGSEAAFWRLRVAYDQARATLEGGR